MKKLILTLVFAATMIFAYGQIGKNFATELKAIIDAAIPNLKGDMINKETGKVITMTYFQCKLPLKGFDTKIILANFYRVQSSCKASATTATMDEIAAKLAVLKKDYTILDSKTDSRLLNPGKNDFTRKILLVDNAENIIAKIELYGGDQIVINIEKDFRSKLSDELQKNTAPVQIGDHFAIELMKLGREDIASIKGTQYENLGFGKTYQSKLLLSGFKVKLKEILGDYTVECEPDGIFSDATMDAMVAGELQYLFVILDSKKKPGLFDLKSGARPLARRIILLDETSRNVKADIQATEGFKEVHFTIYKYDKPLK